MNQTGYDVVVIGSGMGGIAAATLLSKKGYKTLLVESKERLGGRFSTIDYQGFKVPTGASVIHTEGNVVRLMKEMGVNIELRLAQRLFYRIDDKDYELPHGSRLKMLLDLIDKLEIEKGRVAGSIVKEVATQMVLGNIKAAIGSAEKHGFFTFRDWLLQFTDNEKAHEVFDQLCVSLLMAHAWELPASQFFLFMARTGGMKDFYIAPTGTRQIVEELAKVVETNGAVWTNCPAKQVVISKGKASGVVVEKNGKPVEIGCKAIISDVGPKKTVELAGKENFDGDYLKEIRVKLRPHPAVLILVASDKPLCLDGIPGLLTIMGGRRIAGTVPMSNICPELAPPGQHLLYMSAEPLSSLLPMDEEYEKQQCLLDLKEQFPDFEKHGRILLMEPRNIDHEFPECRTWNGYGMSLETPIPNLFNVGDACLGAGQAGSSGATETGYRVVDLVRKKVKV